MPIDVSQPYSPGWTLVRLAAKLEAKAPRLNRLDSYLRGDPPAELTREMSQHFRNFMRRSNLNFAALIVEAVTDRLEPIGFRTGASGDELTDAEAWRIWQANGCDGAVKPFHQVVLGLSEGYSMVGGVDPELGVPLITFEDPRQVVTESDPSRPWRTDRALKLYREAGRDVAIVHPRPGEVWYAERRRNVDDGTVFVTPDASGWEWVDARRVPLSRIPVTRYVNRSDLFGQGKGEFEDHTDHLDRIKHMIVQRMVIATLQAFKQRAIKGLPTTDPATGKEIDYRGLFESGPDALWQLPETAEMWESGQVDMSGVLQATKDDVRDLAAVTRTPLYMLSADAASGSAEGATLQREGLAFRAKDRLTPLSESHEATMSLAFEVLGDSVRARKIDMEMHWAPVMALSLAERADAATKAQAAGVPWETVMSDIFQFTPQQIERMKKERDAAPPLAPTPDLFAPAL